MIVILDYTGGNTGSIVNALKRLDVDPVISRKPKEIIQADKVIFPGVGHARSAITSLARYGLVEVIRQLQQPVLGICLGMQLLCKYTEEGDTTGLGVFDTKVQLLDGSQPVPHTGWNNHAQSYDHPILSQVSDKSDMYFTHSYAANICDHTIATVDYVGRWSSILVNDNFIGTQFHPEKSGQVGQRILKNFLEL